MNLTLEQFKTIFPKCKEPQTWFTAITEVLPQFGITTQNQVACFLAQCGHESGEFNTIVENLNYRAERLLVVFPKYFNATTASIYAGNPEKIANKIYANRMGNGNEASGDGWKFRGKSIIQCTGKENHMEFAKYKGMTVDAVCDYMVTVHGAVEYACFFWKTRGLNDVTDFKVMTKKINGGLNGYDDRKAYLDKINRVLNNG